MRLGQDSLDAPVAVVEWSHQILLTLGRLKQQVHGQGLSTVTSVHLHTSLPSKQGPVISESSESEFTSSTGSIHMNSLDSVNTFGVSIRVYREITTFSHDDTYQ